MNKLIILPFDHRSSFVKDLLKIDYADLKPADKKIVRDYKYLIFEAFLKVYNKAKNKQDFAILVEEEFGSNILKEAKKKKIKIILTTEKTSWPEFDFEYGTDFGVHIKKFKPDFVKVLVRYNIENKKINQRQLEKLKKLSVFCENNNYPFLFELLVPPTATDLKKTKNVKAFYSSSLRVTKTVKAIQEISKQLKVDIWKLEGFSQKGWKEILKVVNDDSQIVVLGRGENKSKVIEWLSCAKKFEQIIGFAVGRTIFLQPLLDYVDKKKNKKQTVDQIAENLNFFVRLWSRD